ncbi:hypothetical protein G3T14_06070 [Methylobacterium sp. BTF04]|uniref:hypothetical protein n=1 Tax=Methylobacterium sp. BTF04 TaxID=2708300 RepID=UPI0013D449E3|nr:hypothetical protein [Methylobacterium sp. BTF04]NEU11695.1 hypothetical protein [Methylobacterium sp. BTF04]
MLGRISNNERPRAIVTRRLALTLCVVLATSASAQNPASSTQRMTCSEAMALVKAKGAILLMAGGPTLERFVRDRSQCDMTEIAELRFVPTRDNMECPIGYRCRDPEFSDWDW